MRKLILVTLLACQSQAAISVSTAWEVRPTVGASTNGGGFVQGATGTDMSVFNNKNAAACSSCQSATVNISVTDGVTAGTTTITSATANFSSAIVGNIIYVSGGTGSVTASRYQVTTFTNSTTIVVDRSTGLTAGTGVTINIGGALDDPATALLFNTTGNAIFVKATGTLTRTATLTLNNSVTPAWSAPQNQLVGYTSTRSDNGRASILLSTNSNLTAIDGSAVQGWVIRNFDIDCASLGASVGVKIHANSTAQNIKVSRHVAAGIWNVSIQSQVLDSEVTAGTAGVGITFTSGDGGTIMNNWVHDNTGIGISVGYGSAVLNNLITNNTGDGIFADGRTVAIMGNTIYGGTNGIVSTNCPLGCNIRNNILAGASAYGLTGEAAAGLPAEPAYDGNAYWNNAAGNRLNLDDTGTVNPINAIHYVNHYDVILSADPFTNKASNDFTLNTTSGGGAAARGTGIPGAFGSQVGYMSFGAIQPQVGGGTSSSAYVQ